MNIDIKNILSITVNFIVTYKKYFISLIILIIVIGSLSEYVTSRNHKDSVTNKTYPKISLESDINVLECKLKQRVCYYENINNSLDSAIENCKDIDYCDTLK